MRDRTPTKVLPNGAIRYGVYDGNGNFLRYEYIRPEDEPTDEGTPLNRETLLSDGTAEALGLETVVLKNLVVNGSFENGDEGWDFDNLVSVGPVPSQVSGDWHGSNALSGYQFGAVQTLPATIKPNNMYYFRMLAGTDGISMATVTVTVGSGSVIPPDTSYDCTYQGTVVSTKCSDLSGNTLNINVNDCNEIYIDAVLLIDLTEAFGEGKEPDQAWCDENIPYFEGSYALKEPTVDEALAQVPTSHMLHRMIGASSELTVSEVSPGDSIGVSDMDADTGKRVTVHNLAQYVYTKSTGRESTFQKLIMGRLF